MWLWMCVALIPASSIFPCSSSCGFISIATPWNLEPSDPLVIPQALTPWPPFHLMNPSCPLGFSVKPQSLRAGVVPAFLHRTFITPVCCKDLDLNLIWLSQSRLPVEIFTWKANLLLTAWSAVPTGYLLNEGLFLMKSTGKILVSGFLWWLFTPLLPMLK